ncbi:hypothetical protein MCOR33_011774, partial [Pyricularia grisea]
PTPSAAATTCLLLRPRLTEPVAPAGAKNFAPSRLSSSPFNWRWKRPGFHDDADSAPREGPGGSTDNGDTRAGPEVSSSGADRTSRKRRRGETEGENGGDNEEEEERVEEEDRRPTPSPRPTRPRRERPDGLIPRQVTCFGCARAFLAGNATGPCADQPGVRSRVRGARPPRCWNCRGGHTCLPLPAGGPFERAAGELGCALFCSPRASDKEVQLLRNVVRYHFRDWTKSQAEELAAFQARSLPAPEPVTGASGVPAVPQGTQAALPNGAQAASGVALVGGVPAVVVATINGRPITGTYFVAFPGGAGAGQ